MILLIVQISFAKINCVSEDERIVIDPLKKRVQITRSGKSRAVKILQQNHHAYRLFGESTYALAGGYVLGLKPSKEDNKSHLTIFRDGEPIASLSRCHSP